jgi:hypothetical protein
LLISDLEHVEVTGVDRNAHVDDNRHYHEWIANITVEVSYTLFLPEMALNTNRLVEICCKEDFLRIHLPCEYTLYCVWR